MTYLANNDQRFCYNYVIASAQEICATVGDYVDFLLEQSSTRVIAILLEAVRDADRFREALARARDADIPVLVTRLGRSARSAELARSVSSSSSAPARRSDRGSERAMLAGDSPRPSALSKLPGAVRNEADISATASS